MANEITLKDIYDIIDKRFTVLEGKIEKYHDSFVHFEEGKVSDLIQRVTKLEEQNRNLQKTDDVVDKEKEKRKDWIWGALEKIIFMLIIPLIGLVLIKTGIINLK